MQNRYLVTLLLPFLLIIRQASGQDQPVNQPEKFVFYDVVMVDSSTAGFLYHNASTWSKDNNMKIITADSISGIIRGENEFSVYKESGVLKKVSGKVSYAFMIEVKDNRYRYHFHNFIFHYYAPDRYHNIIRTGKKKKLEDTEASGWQKLWDNHRSATAKRIEYDISTLKIKIIEKPTNKTVAPAPKKEVKWD